MIKLRHIFFILLLLSPMLTPLLAQTNQSPKDLSTKQLLEIDSAVASDMELGQAPGAMVLVTQNNRIVLRKAFGLRNNRTKEPVTPSTLFLTASVTKTITTATLLSLCREKNIGTYTPIGELLDNLPSEMHELTLHDILSQSSGVLDHLPDRKKFKEDAEAYFQRYGKRLWHKDLQGVFSYTNVGHVLAGMIVEQLSGWTFENVVDSLVLDPLDMNRSTYSVSGEKWSNHSAAHKGGKVVPHAFSYPLMKSSATLFSTADDLGKFAHCFMSRGQNDEEPVFPEWVVEQMSGRYTRVGVMHNYFGYPSSEYGYGLMTFEEQGLQFVGHPGETTSQNLLFAMLPDQKTAIIIMSNAGLFPFIHTFETIVKNLLDADLIQPTAVEDTESSDAPPYQPELSEFEGSYYFPQISGSRENELVVFSRKGTLYLVTDDEQTHELNRLGPELFSYKTAPLKMPIEIRFYRDAEGGIKFLNHYWKTAIKK